MIPLKDTTPRNSFPFITVLLIVVNFVVFFHQISLPHHAADAFIRLYGLVPSRIQLALAGRRYTLAQAFVPLLTCMFLHGGWLHIIGNMWFLWIFGGNVEDRMGSAAYLAFYMICGLGSGGVFVGFGDPIDRRQRSDLRSSRRIYRLLPQLAHPFAGAAAGDLVHGAHTGMDFYRTVVHRRIPERTRFTGERRIGRNCLVGARRWLTARRHSCETVRAVAQARGFGLVIDYTSKLTPYFKPQTLIASDSLIA
jgi:Rhomboid family